LWIACVRRWTSSFWKTLAIWVLAVFGEIASCLAISVEKARVP
jgi:hypothetical protein